MKIQIYFRQLRVNWKVRSNVKLTDSMNKMRQTSVCMIAFRKKYTKYIYTDKMHVGEMDAESTGKGIWGLSPLDH